MLATVKYTYVGLAFLAVGLTPANSERNRENEIDTRLINPTRAAGYATGQHHASACVHQ